MKRDMGLDPDLIMESLGVNLEFIKDEELMNKLDELGGKDAGVIAVMAATFVKYYLESIDCPALLDTFDLSNDKVKEAGKLGIQKAFKDLIDLDKVLNIGEYSHIKSEEQKAEILNRREEFRISDNKEEIIDEIIDKIAEDLLGCDCDDEYCEYREENDFGFKIAVEHNDDKSVSDVKFEKVLDLERNIFKECSFEDIPKVHQDKILSILEKTNPEIYNFVCKNVIDERVVTGSFKKYSEVKEAQQKNNPISLSIWDKMKKNKKGGTR